MHISPSVRRPSRRSVTSAAAWAVPVIAIGAAAPRAAASTGVVLTFSGSGCKYPGLSVSAKKFGYRLEFTVTSTVATTITFQSVTAPKYPDARIVDVGPVSPAPLTVAVPAGTSVLYVDFAADTQVSAGNSANGTATFLFMTGTGGADTVSGDVSGFTVCSV